MLDLSELVAAVKENAASDYVGMWEIHSMLKQDFGPDEATPAQIAAVVRPLLLSGDHVLGQFDGGDFVEWPDDPSGQLVRLQADLSALGHSPGIGEVAWLAKR